MTMMMLLTTLLLIPFFLAQDVVLGLETIVARDDVVLYDRTVLPGRSLMAAQRSDHGLRRRDVKGCLKADHQLHYVDADTVHSSSSFSAKLGIQFQRPALLLEDIEHYLDRVDCYAGGVDLHFHSPSAFAHAHEEFKSVDSFFLITSHEGCNEYGERGPHLVSETIVDFENNAIVLTTTRVPWRHTFDSLKLDFGESRERLHPRHQGGLLRPRQLAASTTTASGASASSSSTSIAYPSAPSATATSVNVTKDFSASYIDKAILPPDSSFGQVSVDGPKLSAGLDVKCKNCTFQGSINLVAGSLTMGPFTSNNTNGILNETEAVFNYIENGYVEFRSDRFRAHVELDNTIEASDQLISWTVPLPVIPITPLLIAGIASVGPQFEPAITAGFQIKADLEFGTGFDVSIPDNSSLVLDLANRNGSSQHGFDNTNITPIPFTASTPSIDLIITAGFQPRLLLGISFFAGAAIAGAGFFLNTPSLTTTLSTVNHVDAKCNNATSATPQNSIFDTLISVKNEVEIGVGVIAQAKARIAGSNNLRDEKEYEVLGKTFDLPSACLAFDKGAKTLGVPAATGTGVLGSTGAGSKSGAVRMGSEGLKMVVMGLIGGLVGGWMIG